jgi:TIR domain
MSARPTAPPRPAQQVFVCYRREESAAHAGRVYDAMVSRFGERNVFMDIDMEPGVDFVERITEVVSGCVALIVVIGPSWASLADADGTPRLEDPDDFVRLEVETALEHDAHVIPALVHGARMPRREDLPPGLKPLARRNALELSDGRWGYDVGRLLSVLDERVTDEEPIPEPPAEPPPSHGWRLALEGALVAAAVAGLGSLAARLIPEHPEVKGSEGPTTAETAEHVAEFLARETVALALVGVALALWLGYRMSSERRLGPWLRGLLVGALAGAAGGAIYATAVFSPRQNLTLPERRRVELASIAVAGGLLGGLLGSIWRPPRVGWALLAGALGGVLFQVVVLVTEADQRGVARSAVSYALAGAAVAGLALVAMVLLDRREQASAGLTGTRTDR